MAELISSGWKKYLHSLQKYPLPTKAITSCVFAGTSDIIAQYLINNNLIQMFSFKFRRVWLMAFLGLVYSGPSAHFTHILLDKIFPNKKNSTWIVLKKVITEQLTYGPLCNVVILSYISFFVERKSFFNTLKKLKSSYPSVQMNGWKVWPLAALINYKFVPLHLRVLFVNIVAMFWSTFLIIKSKSSKKIK